MRHFTTKIVALSATACGLLAVAATLEAHAASSPPAPSDPRTVAVAKWLGVNTPLHDQGWRPVHAESGDRYQTHIDGVGLVEVDAATSELDEVIFDGRLRSTPGGTSIDTARATATATAFAENHFRGLDGLTLRRVGTSDHGTLRETRLDWQLRSGQAWLPTKVSIGINAVTGDVAYFWSERVPVKVSAVPSVTSSAALQRAGAIVPGLTVTEGPTLEVTVQNGLQELVWITEWTHVYTGGTHIPDYRVVWTDAVTGAAALVARS